MSGPGVHPIADDVFLDWWAGELAPAERRRLEEHLLACDDCAARLSVAAAIADGARTLVRTGRLPTFLSEGVLERLRQEGRTIREYRVAAGAAVQCTVAPEDDVLLSRLQLASPPASQVDLVASIDGTEVERLTDLPLDPGATELLLAAPIDVIRSWPARVLVYRLVEVRPQGERPLGEYTFRHTPWPGS